MRGNLHTQDRVIRRLLTVGPGDVANTGLLSIDYDDGAKDDDQWLYLPSLKKTTRISSGDNEVT